MRRQLALILALLLGTVAVATAQDDGPPPDPTLEKLEEVGHSPGHSASVEEVAIPDLPLAPVNFEAGTTCGNATLIDSLPIGGVSTNGGQDIDTNDPELSCMWDSPDSIRGARTLWYKYVPEQSGLVRFETRGSSYDTVLAVHQGTSCSNLLEVACNDDINFFTSEVTVSVLAGETYYIEVADWQVGVTGPWMLNFAAQDEPFISEWDLVYEGPLPFGQTSRHATAVVGNDIYIIGGQVTVGTNFQRTPETIVYNTKNGNWTSKANMPARDGFGYSNTSAAYLSSQGNKGRIYLPSGYIGSTLYDGTHWVYDIANNTWTDNQSLAKDNDQWAAGGPTIYSGATTYRWTDGTDGYFLSGGLSGIFPPKPPTTSTGWIAHNEVYYYAATNNDWDTKIIPPMPTGRFGHAAGLIEMSGSDNLCVAGGMGEDPAKKGARFVLQRVECLDIDQGNWSEVAPLNYERYFAGSAVDPTGNWYVFGGYNNNGELVAVTERYDSNADLWVPLDVRFDLGVINTVNSIRPPRAWPRGGFVGQNLFAIGGESIGGQVLNLVEKINLPDASASYPVSAYMPTFFINPLYEFVDNTFATARVLTLNQAQRNQFTSGLDDVDVFTFQVPSKRNISVQLNNLQSTNEMSLYLYTYDKAFVAISANPGTLPETINKNLVPGQYFVVVQRIFPPVGALPDTREYQILVQG